MALAPGLFVAVTVQVFGSAALLFDWYLGEPVEPYSLVAFTFDALSVSTLWCVVVMLLAVLLRNRLLVALAALILVGVQFWLAFQWPVPLYLQGDRELVDRLNFNLASDLVPSLGTSAAFAKRLALLAHGGRRHFPSGRAASPARWWVDGSDVSRSVPAVWSPSAVSSSAPWPSRPRPRIDQPRRLAGRAPGSTSDDPRADMQSITGTVRHRPRSGR